MGVMLPFLISATAVPCSKSRRATCRGHPRVSTETPTQHQAEAPYTCVMGSVLVAAYWRISLVPHLGGLPLEPLKAVALSNALLIESFSVETGVHNSPQGVQ